MCDRPKYDPGCIELTRTRELPVFDAGNGWKGHLRMAIQLAGWGVSAVWMESRFLCHGDRYRAKFGFNRCAGA